MEHPEFAEDTSLLLEFIAESLEHLEGIDSDLLEYEKDPENRERIDSIFRAIHSIKGASGFLELHGINMLAHRLETLLDQLRNGERSLDNETLDLLLSGCDLVKSLIEEINQRIDRQIEARVAPNEERMEDILSSLNRLIDGKGGEAEGEGSPEKEKVKAGVSQPPSPGPASGYEISEKIIKDFQIEACEHLETCDVALVALDQKRDDRDAVNNLFRADLFLPGAGGCLRTGSRL